ncbi:hypothetical protein [Streptomyces scabiei]|uniref:hypothetical protein n=1 Tax=Streptomyces scabiei TaxID=1930 RepID=UPI0029A973F9|nr:hypothetical protein [Streptomyces scabiei]MDX3111991.1 hypothetical protein [Streptomyces scabiei]
MVERIPTGRPAMPGRADQAHRNLLNRSVGPNRSVGAPIKGAQAARQAQGGGRTRHVDRVEAEPVTSGTPAGQPAGVP